ncbi:MAG TPA: ABC transporter ATP-binding protein [bacterium]|nr:ABC transporter ATP-binding protein [bacterium]
MTASAVLSAEDLHYRYRDDDVLRGVSVRLGPGEILGVLGPNASGKTTLLKNLAGLLKPRSGRVRIGGRDLASLPMKERAKAIAFVPQNEEPFLDFPAEQVVLMGRAPYVGLWGFESQADRTRAREAMERTDTWRLRERGLGELSGGEKQRVILARALAQEASVLLLDEPTSHLDVRYQKELLDLCAALNAENGLSIVMTLHDLNLAALYAHRLILMKDGLVARSGSPAETLTPESIGHVFGLSMRVLSDEKTGLPSCVPMR